MTAHVINLAERRAQREHIRHTIGTTAAVSTLLHEAFEEQERAGDGLDYELAMQRVRYWMAHQ